MKKIALVACLFLPLAAAAQTVTSPNGNVVVKFSLDGSRPSGELCQVYGCFPVHQGCSL